MKFNIKGTEVYISFTFFIAFTVVLLNGGTTLVMTVIIFLYPRALQKEACIGCFLRQTV